MGTINYGTSDYITLGVKPYDIEDLQNDSDFIDWCNINNFSVETVNYDYFDIWIRDIYDMIRDDIKALLAEYSFYYYHITIKSGYYEGFYLDIENNFSVAYDSYEDKREAQKEITEIKQLLIDCAACGLVACYPGWCMGYEDYPGTIKAIKEAVKAMREEARTIPTWRQYERG